MKKKLKAAKGKGKGNGRKGRGKGKGKRDGVIISEFSFYSHSNIFIFFIMSNLAKKRVFKEIIDGGDEESIKFLPFFFP